MRWAPTALLAILLAPQLYALQATPEWLARRRLPDWVQVVVAEPSFEQHVLRTGARDFSRMDIWRVVPAREQPEIKLRAGDVLYVEKSESGSGLISWDGTQYRWTRLAD